MYRFPLPRGNDGPWWVLTNRVDSLFPLAFTIVRAFVTLNENVGSFELGKEFIIVNKVMVVVVVVIIIYVLLNFTIFFFLVWLGVWQSHLWDDFYVFNFLWRDCECSFLSEHWPINLEERKWCTYLDFLSSSSAFCQRFQMFTGYLLCLDLLSDLVWVCIQYQSKM